MGGGREGLKNLASKQGPRAPGILTDHRERDLLVVMLILTSWFLRRAWGRGLPAFQTI